MKSKIRLISIVALCLFGAISMFLLGVMTERKWVATRAEAGDPLQMEDLVAGVPEQDAPVMIDLNQLHYPEALLEETPPRIERPLARDDTPEPVNPEATRHDTPPDFPSPSGSTSPVPMPTEASRMLFIQLGAFQSNDNAKKAVSLFGEKGFQAKVIKSDDPANGLHFKVRIGPFESTDRALATIEKLKQQNIPHFLVYPSG